MAATTYHVHPFSGLTRVEPSLPVRRLVPERWHDGSEDEQDELEARFLATVLGAFAGRGAAFEADLPLPHDVERLRAAAQAAGVELTEAGPGVFHGDLVPALCDAFPPHTQLVLDVRTADRVKVHLHDDVRELFVELEDGEVDALVEALAAAGFRIDASDRAR